VALARSVRDSGAAESAEVNLGACGGASPRAARLVARPAGGGIVAVAGLDLDGLRAAEDGMSRHEMVMEATHDAVWDWDVATGETWWNRRQYEMLGRDPESTTPSYEVWKSHVHPEDLDRVLRTIEGAMTGGATLYQDQYRFLRADGSERVALDRGYIERDAAGRPQRMIGVMSDITAERTASAALRASEERFREMTSAIDQVFWMSNRDLTETIYVSPAYERIWGRSCESLYRDPLSFIEAIHEDDRERIMALLPRQREGSFDEVFRIRRPDRTIAWIRDRAFPIRDAAGDVTRIVGVATDITAQRHLEQQLAQAQRMESIGRLAGGIAHDFNNLLTVILASVRLVMARLPAGERVHADLMRVKEAGERAARLTAQLLLFAQRRAVAPTVVDVNEVAQQMQRLLRRTIGEHIELDTILDPGVGAVMGDRVQLEQVLINLAINARDAMPGGGRLIIETRDVAIGGAARRPGTPALPPGDYVQIAVSDTGVGIESDFLPHIFEPFFTTKPAGQGTGLGLAICHGIVRQAGGTIAVDSAVGAGTTFTILLPRSGERIRPVERRPPAAVARGTETVLFVEDDEAVRRVGSSILAEHSYEVLTASGGDEALELASTYPGPIHLLVTDVVMPRMSGIELARLLLEQRPDLRVLYTSGYAEGALVDEVVSRPGVDFLPKPYIDDTLLEKTRDLLDRPRTA
jgi:two-component system, cell cycle sensor histidine kinase and response regulator CckA